MHRDDGGGKKNGAVASAVLDCNQWIGATSTGTGGSDPLWRCWWRRSGNDATPPPIGVKGGGRACYTGLHLRVTVPVALAAFRRELACVSPRPFNGLELACSPEPGDLTLTNGIEVSAILHCGLANAFPA